MGNQEKGFQAWLNSPKIKKYSAMAYGLGAAVVILGALFKLMHWPFAGIMLTAGMLTEFVLFVISAFEKPHEDAHWERVFPVLQSGEEKDNPLKNLSLTGVGASAAPAATVAGGVIPEQIISDFKKSIENLNRSANQLAELELVAQSTRQYVEKVSGLSQNIDSFGKSTDQLVSITKDITGHFGTVSNASRDIAGHCSQIKSSAEEIQNNSTEYVEKLTTVNGRVSQLTLAYDEQLKMMQNQLNTVKSLHEATHKMSTSANGSVEDSLKIKKEMGAMTDQLIALNELYARMIKSMTSSFNR